MVVLIEEILKDVFKKLGDSSISDNPEDSKDKPNALAKFMLAGRQPLEVACKFFEAAKTAVLHDDCIEIFTDKEDSAKFQEDILSIKAVVKLLQKNVTKLECKKFNEKYLTFWDAISSSIKELELTDFNFDNPKYAEAVKKLESLHKATVELDIYCIGFMEGLSLKCNELVLKGEAYDQIENLEDQNIQVPSAKKLTVRGHYVGWGVTDMALEVLIKNLKTICPDLEDLTLIVDDDMGGEDEEPQTYIDLISKPIDDNLKLKVIFNFAMMETTWQKSKFYQELKKNSEIKLIGDKDGSKSEIKLGDNKLVEFNLSSEMEEDEEEEEPSVAEPAAKKMKT